MLQEVQIVLETKILQYIILEVYFSSSNIFIYFLSLYMKLSDYKYPYYTSIFATAFVFGTNKDLKENQSILAQST